MQEMVKGRARGTRYEERTVGGCGRDVASRERASHRQMVR